MGVIQEFFNNREIAIGIWVIIGLAVILPTKPARQFIKTAIPILFCKKFVIFYIVFLSFLGLVLFALNWVGLWDLTLLKDTVFWVLFVELPLFAKAIEKADGGRFFSKLIRENVAIVVAIEFFVGFWTFSLITEIILIPLTVLISVLQVLAGQDKKHRSVKRFFDGLLVLWGIILLINAIYSLIRAPNQFLSFDTLKSLLLPLVLLVFNLPVVYGLALYNTYEHMLKNRRYIGEYQYRDVLIPDGIPAIVPKELFDRVQEKIEKNKKAPARHKAEDDYLLTTKLFCGYCGAYLCGESGKSRNGTIHHYYKCVSVKKKRTDCKKKPVRKQWLEDLVVNEVMKVVMDDQAIEAIVSMVMDLQDRENTNLPLYEQQLQEAQRGIDNLLNAIQQGILTKSTKTRLEELEATKEDLEIKIANEKIAKPRISPEFVTFWLHKFRKLDVRQQSHRKMLIDAFVNAIYLYDDKMVITFNYKDGTRTIALDDVKKAVKENTGSDLDCLAAPFFQRTLGD